jgi:hypothetical protein
MKIGLKKIVDFEVSYLLVNAEVRYWEDASVNGVEDSAGDLIPMRNGDIWEPVIELKTGEILDWPVGTTADIHYKVCDAGEYWLLGPGSERIAKYDDHYVPDILCPKESGHGDYIIMKVDGAGKIDGWRGEIDEDEWVAS